MAKRKRGQAQAKADTREDFDPRASKLAIKSYEDVGDSEDEFHANRDKILLDPGSRAKRQKQRDDDDLELSDEEVLGYAQSDEDIGHSEGNSDLEASDVEQDGDLDEEENSAADPGDVDEEMDAGWGGKRSDYYNADEIETEQDMLDEEAEARKIQQRQRKALTEADFVFDADEWADAGDEDETGTGTGEGGVVFETLPQLNVREGMTDAEKSKLMMMRYPELEPLLGELKRLGPIYDELAHDVTVMQKETSEISLVNTPAMVIRFQALSGYLASIAMYFALLTSTAQEDVTKSLPLPADEIRQHDVIHKLEQYQKLWTEMQDLVSDEEDDELDMEDASIEDDEEVVEEDGSLDSEVEAALPIITEQDKLKAASDARRAERIRQTKESLASLSHLDVDKVGKRQKMPTTAAALTTDDGSEVGDEQMLLPHEEAEKARKRKSLRFYTSQIAQKANKRANAGRIAGGDDDIPRRERLRDRQDRLNREATNRGKKNDLDGPGEALDGKDSGDEARAMTNRDRENLDEGEQAYEQRVLAKRNLKLQKEDAYRRAKEQGGRVVERREETVGPNGRREVGYVIEKNRGLAPKRKKIAKNPRVKKRMRFEDKTKKLRSMKPTYKGGEGRGGYGGELTGIKKNLVRSTKF